MTKGDRTRQFIISTAKELFAHHGYLHITMSQICDACALSRGGLYRHFGSTKDIFLEVLNEDKNEKFEVLNECIAREVPALEIFEGFVQDRKERTILGKDKGMGFAIHEFSHAEPDQKAYMCGRKNTARDSLAVLLAYGQKQGVFKDFICQDMALHILLLLDSLETTSSVLDITEEEVDQQFAFLYDLLLEKSEDMPSA